MTSTQKPAGCADHTVACSDASDLTEGHPLATERLRGAPLSERHRALYCELHRDPTIMAYIGPALDAAHANRSFDAALQSCARAQRFYWAFGTHTGPVFAVAGLAHETSTEAQIGCLLRADKHGKGYATEMLRAITQFGFTRLALAAITSFSSVRNAASDVLMRRLGYHREPIPELPHGLGAGYAWQMTTRQWATLLARAATE